MFRMSRASGRRQQGRPRFPWQSHRRGLL